MTGFTQRTVSYLILLILLVAIGCSELRDEIPIVPVTPVTYEADVKQILDTQCVSCHSGTTPPGDYNLSTLIGILDSGTDNIANAIPGIAASLLLQKVGSAGTMNQYIGSTENEAALTAWVVDNKLGIGEPVEHSRGWLDPTDVDFHGKYLQSNNFELAACRDCHGADYAGGISGNSCLVCHESSPEDCSTCHGRSFNPSGAPPKDIAGNVSTTNRTVGAHATHLAGGEFSRPVECSECHDVPIAVVAEGHIDDSPHAELNFGSLASNLGTDPKFNDDFTCSNVYCHGEFSVGSNENNPDWTKVDEGIAGCGTRHGLPPSGQTRNGISHPDVFNCSICHSSVVSTNFPIISDRTKHINGTIDF